MRAAWSLLAFALGGAAARAELVPLGSCGPVERRHDHVEVLGTTLRGLGKTPVARFGVVAFRDGRRYGNTLRIEYLQAGWRIIKRYPLHGTGPDTVDMVFQNPARPFRGGPPERPPAQQPRPDRR